MDLSRLGVSFDQYHTLRDWGLKWVDLKISGAKAKTKAIEIPGRKVPIDATEAEFGRLTFENRTISLDFLHPRVFPAGMQPKDSQIANLISGQRVKIVLDTEPDCYWLGRPFVESSVDPARFGSLSVHMDIDVEPYRHWSGDLWPWGSFSFVDGVVPTQSVDISGSKTITLPAMYRPGTPKVVTDSAMTFQSGTKNWTTTPNQALTLSDITVFKDNVSLQVSGTGTLSIVLFGETL